MFSLPRLRKDPLSALPHCPVTPLVKHSKHTMADSYRCSEGEREDRASGVVPVSGPNRAKQLWSRLKRYVLRLSSGSSSARSQREYSRRKALDAIASGTIQTEVSPGDAFAPLQRSVLNFRVF